MNVQGTSVHQTSVNTHNFFFIGGLFPSELGLSPNKVFWRLWCFTVSYFMFLVWKQPAGSSVEWSPYLESARKAVNIFDWFLLRKLCALTVWRYFAPPLSSSDACSTRKWGYENSLFLIKVCPYLSIFYLYDKTEGGENLNLNCHMFLLLTCGHNKIYLWTFRSPYSSAVACALIVQGQKLTMCVRRFSCKWARRSCMPS